MVSIDVPAGVGAPPLDTTLSISTVCSLLSVNVSIIPVLLLLMTSSFVGVYSSSYSHSKSQYRPVFDDASTFSDDDSITPIHVIPGLACFNLSDMLSAVS